MVIMMLRERRELGGAGLETVPAHHSVTTANIAYLNFGEGFPVRYRKSDRNSMENGENFVKIAHLGRYTLFAPTLIVVVGHFPDTVSPVGPGHQPSLIHSLLFRSDSVDSGIRRL
jgi:hypothetical protein